MNLSDVVYQPQVQRFVLLDVETTGLEDDATLLELAMFRMRYRGSWQVEEVLHRVYAFIEVPGKPVYEAHHHNGLLAECYLMLNSVYPSRAEVEKFVPEGAIACGRNVHFDLKALDRQWPGISRRFSHRHLDLASFTLVQPKGDRPASTHRALHDCLLELAELQAIVPREDLWMK